MTTVYFTRTNPDGTVDQQIEHEFWDEETAEDYAWTRNSQLAAAGIPSSVAFFYTV